MKTIRVTGKGQLKVHPDMTRITMELKGGSREYGETLEKSAKETEQLKDILAPFGFDRTDLKTLRFDVETLYESYQEKKVWKERFNGYQYIGRNMRLEIRNDQRLVISQMLAQPFEMIPEINNMPWNLAEKDLTSNAMSWTDLQAHQDELYPC